MNTPRRIVEKSLNFDKPDRIPRQTWILRWSDLNHPEEAEYIRQHYPDDIVFSPVIYKNDPGWIGGKFVVGKYVDEWGCTFHNAEDGLMGVVKEPVVKDLENWESLKTPDHILSLDKDEINRFCKASDRFVVAGAFQRPLERFQFLRTMELSMMDFLIESPGLQKVLDKIHNHYCKEMEMWASTDVDAVYLMDDWGMQKGLLLSPDIYRKYFRPMYKDYIDIAKKHNKYFFMHSDGDIIDIIDDLAEIGVNAINSQVFCMDFDELERKCKSKINFWGEIDRQKILPSGSEKDIKEAVHAVYNHLYQDGGVIAQIEFGPGAKAKNIIAAHETWNQIKTNQ